MIKQRETNRWIKPHKDKKGNLLCLIPTCNNKRQKYKTSNRTRNYCKKHGCGDMEEFTSWRSLREKALKRDNYTCVECGDNRKNIKVITKYKRIKNMNEFLSGKEKAIDESYDYEYTRSNFVVDHIKPIALGGDEWDTNNLQTLCLKCNKKKTKLDMKNIAIRRQNKSPHVKRAISKGEK